MLKILIAGGTEGFRSCLRELLISANTVICATDGVQAWELFQKQDPQLLVVDLELPGIDGMTLLRRIHAAGHHPAVIVLGRMMSDYTVEMLLRMKVSYIMRKPCDVQAVAEHVIELLCYHTQEQSPVEAAIMDILSHFGITGKLSGIGYLLLGTVLMAQDPSQYITKNLYCDVGKVYGKSNKSVERCIRNAIEKGWTNGDPEVWKQHFGIDENGLPVKPSNSIFILKMVELLKKKL